MFSRRLTHVLPPRDLALIIAPTYAASAGVDFDEARERLERALKSPRVSEALYEGISAALQDRQWKRTTADELIDNLSAGLQKRRSRVKPAQPGPAISAAMVLINVE